MSTDPIHEQLGIYQNPWNFFSTRKEGKATFKESESVTDIPPYFEENNQTNSMSLREELAATRFIVYNFTILTLDIES